MVPIRSVKQYIKEFGVDGLGKGVKPSVVHDQLLDAFQKEIFGQLMLKYNDVSILGKLNDDNVNDKTRDGIRNIIEQANRKWRRLCIEFPRFPGAANLIRQDELLEYLKDTALIQENDIKNPGETAVDVGSASDVHILEEGELANG
jgi:hypothetical protein